MPVPAELQQHFRAQLHDLGFDRVRFAAVADWPASAPGTSALEAWLAAGMHGDMQWMERTAAKRVDASLVLPDVRSLVLLGVNYWAKGIATFTDQSPRWARYSLYEDYHDTLKPALVKAGEALERTFGAGSADYRYYVDAGPVLERGWAARSGLGFVGKNAMLISREDGNWLFLAALLTRVDFTPDSPLRPTVWTQGATYGKAAAPAAERSSSRAVEPPVGLLCGKCTRCLDACPTDAFAQPGVVDARRCISYQTIENKGVIPRELRPGIGNRIYGCDVCLEVCPWNRFAHEGRQLVLASRGDIAAIPLRDLLGLTPERFAEIFRRTPIKRLKLAGLLRNACIVAGNSGDASLLPELVALATAHVLPLVRAHAVWAVFKLGGGPLLNEARLKETEPIVLAEYTAEEAKAVTPERTMPLRVKS